MSRIEIYTDGSCLAKDRVGGFGIYIKEFKDKEEKEHFYFKGFLNTSIGRMELLGIFKGLRLIKNQM